MYAIRSYYVFTRLYVGNLLIYSYLCAELIEKEVRGPISPLFLLEFKMINAAVVEGIIKDKLASENKYIVDLVVSPGNLISIEIDSLEGIQISDCVEVSKLIDANLDREVEDYELQVSSAGIGQPFKVKQQYHKNIT